jgi:microcystin-dependent protein
MSDFFVGQVMLSGYPFAPRGFAMCNGQTLPIAQNQALFSLIGTQFGGNGVTTFLLPDLRGRVPVGSSSNYPVGMVTGVENVTLTTQTMPPHTHLGYGTTAAGTTRDSNNNFYGAVASEPLYAPASGTQVVLNPATLSANGGSQPHPNMQPFSVLNFCIALTGVFPSRN